MGCYHPIESLLVMLMIFVFSVREFLHMYPPFYINDWQVTLKHRFYVFDLYDKLSNPKNQALYGVLIGYFYNHFLFDNRVE